MEKEDKLIKELLKEGFLKPAPDGFTDTVMQSVISLEKQKPASFIFYLSAIFAAIVAGLGVIYYTNPELPMKYLEYFVDFLYSLAMPFMNLFSGISLTTFNVQGSGLFLGILMIITLLLGFDRFLSARNRAINMFV